MRSEMTELLKELKVALSEIYEDNLRGIYLYGSYARQQEDPESDIDVVIILRDFVDYCQEIQRTSHVIAELSLKYNVSISPVRLRAADWIQGDSPFLNNVRKECLPV